MPLVENNGHHFDFRLEKREDTRPSVFLMSYAAAYATWYQVGTWFGLLSIVTSQAACTCLGQRAVLFEEQQQTRVG